MTRYATKEKQYCCDRCDRWVTEREMIPTVVQDGQRTTPGGYCPGCKQTAWMKIVTIGTDVVAQRDNIIVSEAQPGDTVVFLGGQEGTGRSIFWRENNETL